MRVVYSDQYDLKLGNHVFPSTKYRLIKERLLEENVIRPDEIDEYEREPAVDSMMCLKYISFNNTFTLPDASDSSYFKVKKSEWRAWGGPYSEWPPDMTIIAFFNRKIDPVSGGKKANYEMTLGKRKAKITKVWVSGPNLYVRVRDDKFTSGEIDSCHLSVKAIKDINGNLFNKRRELVFRQFRELFVQDYNRPLSFRDTCFIRSIPLKQNCISISDNSKRYWMNTPLKAEEKQQDSQDQ